MSAETAINFLETELVSLESNFLDLLKQFDKLSEIERIQLAMEIDFFEELQKAGLTKVLDELQNEYASIFARLTELAETKGIGISPFTFEQLNILTELDTNSILRSAESYSSQFKSSLIKGFINGEQTKTIIENLDNIGLKTNQLITAVNTARDSFERTALALTFEDEPDTKYRLSHVMDSKTRCQCRAVFTHQKKEGYTREEILKGAWTKLAKQYCPKFEGKYSWTMLGGFNCRGLIEIVE